jgi:hypothetical protein
MTPIRKPSGAQVSKTASAPSAKSKATSKSKPAAISAQVGQDFIQALQVKLVQLARQRERIQGVREIFSYTAGAKMIPNGSGGFSGVEVEVYKTMSIGQKREYMERLQPIIEDISSSLGLKSTVPFSVEFTSDPDPRGPRATEGGRKHANGG